MKRYFTKGCSTSLAKGNGSENYHEVSPHTIRMGRKQTCDNTTSQRGDRETVKLHALLVGMYKGATALENSVAIFGQKPNLPHNPTISSWAFVPEK